uniref:Uncharacterized protein n=1 Tax=Anguilla anguilla TaxID=7936 RepID=A0A0E9RGV4_ANGAN
MNKIQMTSYTCNIRCKLSKSNKKKGILKK